MKPGQANPEASGNRGGTRPKRGRGALVKPVAAIFCMGAAGLIGLAGFSPAAQASPQRLPATSGRAATQAAAATTASVGSSSQGIPCSSATSATGSSSGHTKIGRVLAGNIEGSAASPYIAPGHGPLADQGAEPGATDATIMGNCGRSGPAAGGLRAVGSGPTWAIAAGIGAFHAHQIATHPSDVQHINGK